MKAEKTILRKRLGNYRNSFVKSFQYNFRIPVARLLANYLRADIAFFYRFKQGPYGGGNQFLRALWMELGGRGLRLENQRISRTTRACLINSHHLDPAVFRKLYRPGCRVVHRVDGPLSVYRGKNDGTDRKILQLNQEFADVTIFQSIYSLEKHREMGMAFNSPTVIPNAANPNIFHPHGRIPYDRDRKIRLISTSWSPNPNKGAPTYKWLEDKLDWDRFDYTFVGNTPVEFDHIDTIPPLPSAKLADTLRRHDIFITASKHESCSNAIIEALNCGLPVIYIDSGSNGEIVKHAGLGFREQNEILVLLDSLVDNYKTYQQNISIPSITQVASLYLEAMGVNS